MGRAAYCPSTGPQRFFVEDATLGQSASPCSRQRAPRARSGELPTSSTGRTVTTASLRRRSATDNDLDGGPGRAEKLVIDDETTGTTRTRIERTVNFAGSAGTCH
jgi:hypothetical protein